MARLVVLSAAALSLASAAAHAQLLHRATDSVASPASSLVLQDDAVALDINPAAPAFLAEPSVAYVHSELDQEASWLARGDALYAAVPVLHAFTAALTLQSIRPDGAAARPLGAGDPADRAMAALGLSFAPSPLFGFGLTARGFSSGNARFDGLAALDIGLMLRPSAWLTMSAVGRDLFVSREGFGTGGLDLGSSFLFGVGLRPFAHEALTFDFGLAMDASDAGRMAGRGGVTTALPFVGSASGVVEVEGLGDDDAALRVIAELALQWGGFTAAFGGTGGDGFDGDLGGYGMLRVDGQPRSGLPQLVRVLDVRLSSIGPRSLIGLSLLLERARLDRRIGGLLLRMRTGGMPLAIAQELRLMLDSFKRAGKPVVCHLESVGGSGYYACSKADEVLIDPVGDIRLLGLSSEVLLFGGALRKLGIHADFVRIGDHKSAPEQYTQDKMSEAAREQTRELLDAAHRRMLADLSSDLGKSRESVADLIDRGPYLARGALDAGLVKGLADEYELKGDKLKAFGGRSLTGALPDDPARRWGKEPAVGVVLVDESIVDGESVDIPLVDIHMSGGRTIVGQLEAMASDPTIRAIVLRVDSPGGSVMASDQIWRAIRRARERKPVIASMGSVAASGGYYISSAADEIWADPSTVTGAIGIFYGKVDVATLADKLGITVEHFRRGRRAGGQSLFRPFTGEERAALVESLRDYYQLFLERVALGRGMSVAEVDRLGRGRVYAGDDALANGLVDRLGGLGSALMRARHLGDLPGDSPVVVRPEPPGGLISLVLGGAVQIGEGQPAAGDSARPATAIPNALRPMLRMLVGMAQMGDGKAMALLPFEVDY